MKLILTGGAGNVGAYVSSELSAHDMPHTILDMREPEALAPGAQFMRCDLMNLEETRTALAGCEAVIHLAAIPSAFHDPPEKVMSVNMVTCFNVLDAARHNNVRRVVYAGSESSTGFGIHDVVLKPQYLPIDEAHPLWPHESYSFTKRYGEDMVENYARAFGVEGISLRYCGVWTRHIQPDLIAMVAPYKRGELAPQPWFGSYVAGQDVAQAVRLAVQYQFTGNEQIPFEAFFITAANTCYAEPTLDVMRRIYDDPPEVRDTGYYQDNPQAPAFDIRKAQRMLGYTPAYDWRQIEQWESETPATSG